MIMLVTTAVVIFLATYPVAWLLFGSVWSSVPRQPGTFTFDNYINAYGQTESLSMLANSLLFATGGMIFSLALGGLLAWLIIRTNMPFRGFFEIIPILPYMIPGILFTVGWIFLLSPRTGLINNLLMTFFSLKNAPFDVYSVTGMVWVFGLEGSTLAYLLISSSLRLQDSSFEEAAIISGSSVRHVVTRITLPMVKPALLSAVMLLFIRSLETFEVPALIGMPARIYVFTTQIYREMTTVPPGYGRATAHGVSLLAITLVALYLYRYYTRRGEKYVTVAGKGYRPREIDIGIWRWPAFAFCCAYLILGAVLPIIMVILGSVLPYWGILAPVPTLEALMQASTRHYRDVFGMSIVPRAFMNSVFLAVVGASVTVLLTAVVAYVSVKTKGRGRTVLEMVSFLPYAFPGIVISVGLLWAYIALPIGVYGTIWMLLIAYMTRFMPYGLRTASSSLVQIHPELEEASRTSGASWTHTFRTVVLPLIKPAVVAAWIYLAIIFLRELSTSVLLYSFGSEVLSVVMLNLYDNNYWERLSALGVVMTALTVLLAVAALKLTRVKRLGF